MKPNELPDRRWSLTEIIPWENMEWTLGVGFDRSGHACEIFLTPAKSGRTLDATIADGAIMASHLMRRGMRASELRERLKSSGAGTADSLFSKALDIAIGMELAMEVA